MTPDSLTDLAGARRLVTGELHPPNDFYGQATVLKRYAGQPGSVSLPLVFEHGVMLGDGVWAADVGAGLPTILCPSPRRSALIEVRSPAITATPVGPPIAYAGPPGEALDVGTAPADGPLLAFPAHSTHHIDVRYDVDAFVAGVRELRGKAWPEVVVCVYWRDVQRGTHRRYEAAGLRCVSAGHMFDSSFLDRLKHLLASASAVVTNEVGTHVLYAAALGRPVGILAAEVDYAAPADVLARDQAVGGAENIAAVARAFAGPPPASLSEEQRRLVTEICGTEYVRAPAEAAALLERAERAYRQRVPAPRRLAALARARGRAIRASALNRLA